jgi:hypothetical protein
MGSGGTIHIPNLIKTALGIQIEEKEFTDTDINVIA